MAIKFECPVCGNHLSTKNDYVGKEGKCKCGAAVIVPGNSEKMKFACTQCGNGISVSNRHAGQKGKCPACKSVLNVPLLGILIETDAPAVANRLATLVKAGTVNIACNMCNANIQTQQDSPDKIVECLKCGCFTKVPGKQRMGFDADRLDAETQGKPVDAAAEVESRNNSRKRNDRICRIYRILSWFAIIGPATVIVGYVLFCLVMGGVPVPGTGGIFYIIGFLARIFPLIASPLAIGAALFMKFRYGLEMNRPLKAAILFYAIVLYNVIEYRLLF